MAKKARKVKRRYRKIRVSFLARESNDVESLISLCRLIGKVESLPKNLFVSNDAPIYYLVLKLKPGIRRDRATNVLLDTWPVQSVGPTR